MAGQPRSSPPLTGWRPETSLEDGLRRTIDWFREHPDALARLL